MWLSECASLLAFHAHLAGAKKVLCFSNTQMQKTYKTMSRIGEETFPFCLEMPHEASEGGMLSDIRLLQIKISGAQCSRSLS